jgi:phosphohistidine phosphatase SixA
MLNSLRRCVPCTLVLLALGIAQDPAPDPPVPLEPVTVIAVRHAEKDLADRVDPKLTERGRARARELARVLQSAGVTHLFSTDTRRTRQTLAPLASALDLEVELYSPAALDSFAVQLAGLPPGSVAVVSGHSNTTPGLVLSLGGRVERIVSLRGTPALKDSEYDRLFVTVLAPRGLGNPPADKTLEMRYGEPSASK